MSKSTSRRRHAARRRILESRRRAPEIHQLREATVAATYLREAGRDAEADRIETLVHQIQEMDDALATSEDPDVTDKASALYTAILDFMAANRSNSDPDVKAVLAAIKPVTATLEKMAGAPNEDDDEEDEDDTEGSATDRAMERAVAGMRRAQESSLREERRAIRGAAPIDLETIDFENGLVRSA